MVDLTYTTSDMFTTFYADSPQGVEVWNAMAIELDGNVKVLNVHLASILSQLRKAGYKVAKLHCIKF